MSKQREVVGGANRPVIKWSVANSAVNKTVKVNARPGYTYQFVNPEEVDAKLVDDEFTDFMAKDGPEDVSIAAWGVVKDKRRVQRAVGEGTDTTARHKEMILVEIPDEEFAKLNRKAELNTDMRQRLMMGGAFGNTKIAEGIKLRQRQMGEGRGFIPHQALESNQSEAE